ncbi:MAG: Lrp/AsnC family transcriptional regulator [Trueperaceae bacterium]|nr:Lrp/AsnC family transcriptional regulator [Trueperaceae bacterium]
MKAILSLLAFGVDSPHRAQNNKQLTTTMDTIDRKLLSLLQHNAELKHSELAEAVGLSSTGVHKRLKRLKDEGFIKKTVVVLDRNKLELDLLCFLKVSFKSNMLANNLQDLPQAVASLPEVLECYTLTGSTDAIIKVAVPDHTALRDFLRRLALAQNVIDRVETCIVLEEFKEGTALPLEVAP